jgi:DNA-binding response OmpR family regulator
VIRRVILVVDDSPLTLDALRRGLIAAGFVVRSASDLDDVPTTLKGSDVDLVLMDVEMAEAFGDDLAVMLRIDSLQPPIYLLSALPEDELSERAAIAGVDGWMSKHDGVDAVVERVVEILGAVASPRTRDLRAEMFGRFIDSARLRLAHARRTIGDGRDGLRQVAYELHAMVGEAAILGFTELAALSQQGRHAVARCLDHGEPPDACAALLAELHTRIDALAAEAPHHAPSIETARPVGERRHVLLVDDSDVFRTTLAAILEDVGYVVHQATSLAGGRELLATMPGDIVLLDVELGDGSGVELIALARGALPAAVIVVLTGGDPSAVPLGADLFLHKTLDPTSLLVKLDRALTAKHATASP